MSDVIIQLQQALKERNKELEELYNRQKTISLEIDKKRAYIKALDSALTLLKNNQKPRIFRLGDKKLVIFEIIAGYKCTNSYDIMSHVKPEDNITIPCISTVISRSLANGDITRRAGGTFTLTQQGYELLDHVEENRSVKTR